jgi:hypothetical protein
MAPALLACVAGVIALAGTGYALFGPLIDEGGGASRSYFDDGLSPLAWAVFAGYTLGGLGVLAAGGSLLSSNRRQLATNLLMVSGLSLLVLAGLSVMGAGWLILPGAILAQVAILLTFHSAADA